MTSTVESSVSKMEEEDEVNTGMEDDDVANVSALEQASTVSPSSSVTTEPVPSGSIGASGEPEKKVSGEQPLSHPNVASEQPDKTDSEEQLPSNTHGASEEDDKNKSEAKPLVDSNEASEDADKTGSEGATEENGKTDSEEQPPKAAAAPIEVIELLESDDDVDSDNTDGLIQDAVRLSKRQKRDEPPPASVEASYQARAAHMPAWMKQAPAMANASAGESAFSRPSVASASQPSMHPPVPHRPQPQLNPYLEPAYLGPLAGFIPTWEELVPIRQTLKATNKFRGYHLSLLNVSEFTITGMREFPFSRPTTLKGLRPTIKSISREHGKASFERDESGETEGKWRIPLGAYHALYAYLVSDPMCRVEAIPEIQLKIASLGRARLEKDYPSAEKLISRGVPARLAATLAPFQRGGVDFVLEKGGRALIADEMGLGKTIQAVASMSVYHEEWPILVLCPSTARYHWENEFRNWLGEDSAVNTAPDVFDEEKVVECKEKSDEDAASDSGQPKEPSKPAMLFLKKSQINVLGSGNDAILPTESTRVVICSYGLAPNLIKNEKLRPGLFRCAIVDESHMLKNKATQRTRMLLPVLLATTRCVLLSGTPAFARPMELWPQLSILGTERHGWWQDESRFVKKYVRNVSTQRRAELHTLLTGTVMIRRMKSDILKSLPSKIREQATVDGVMNKDIRKEMQECMMALRRGKGKLSEYAREHTSVEQTNEQQVTMETEAVDNTMQTGDESQQGAQTHPDVQQQLLAAEEQLKLEINERYVQGQESIRHAIMTTQHQLDAPTMNGLMQQMVARLEQEIQVYHQERLHQIRQQHVAMVAGIPTPAPEPESTSRKTALSHMYSLTGQVKLPLIVNMLKQWLDDPTKGKLCIFAHHISVLDAIVKDAGLSLGSDSNKKYIRIDGSTSPKARQEYINTFQRDPSVRIAVLGITAAGVAVTLTASSTVWFAELFWTPALMIQAEDRCHRIGQQAQVHCLYFVARGTLDELLWKLMERKCQDLGEFVEGKEKMKMVVNKTSHSAKELEAALYSKPIAEEEDDDYVFDEDGRKRERAFSPLTEIDLEIEHDIEELGLSEQAMVKAFEVEDEEAETSDSGGDSKPAATTNTTTNSQKETAGRSENEAICLCDDEDEAVQEVAPPTKEAKTTPYKDAFNYSGPFSRVRLYRMLFAGPRYGLQFTLSKGRMVVTGGTMAQRSKPSMGDILVAVNGQVLPLVENTKQAQILQLLQNVLLKPPVQLMFAEDSQFTEHVVNQIALLHLNKQASTSDSSEESKQTPVAALQMASSHQNVGSDERSADDGQSPNHVIELLDD